MSITFTVPVRGNPPPHGNFDTPAGAMARGIGVVPSSDTVAACGSGLVPHGFLNSLVTTDGPTLEELMYIGIDSAIMNEKKVSEGKVQVFPYQPGVSYITKGNVLSGVTFAVDEYVYMAATGEFADGNGASEGDSILGVVEKIDVHFMGEDDCMEWQAVANLGEKVA